VLRLRGKENSWWLLLVVPLALAYLAISAIKGSGLQGILGLGGGKSEAGEPDEAMEAKRRRRQVSTRSRRALEERRPKKSSSSLAH